MSIDGTSFDGEQVQQDADGSQHTAEIISFEEAKAELLQKRNKGRGALNKAQARGPNKQSTLHGIFRERVAEIAKSDAERKAEQAKLERLARILALQNSTESAKPPVRRSLLDMIKGLFN